MEVHFVGVCKSLLPLVEPAAGNSALLTATGGVISTAGVATGATGSS